LLDGLRPAEGFELPIINYQLSIINNQLSIINYQLSIINYQFSPKELSPKHISSNDMFNAIYLLQRRIKEISGPNQSGLIFTKYRLRTAEGNAIFTKDEQISGKGQSIITK
jgi:hypothetical protein